MSSDVKGPESIHGARGASRRDIRWPRRRRRPLGRRGWLTRNQMLPLLIRMFAGFARVDGEIEEWEIDSTLGFLRYDFPETVYSELRQLFREALREDQDLDAIANDLASRLQLEDKILLGIQLYALISRADLRRDHLKTFYLFMTNLGIAEHAIEFVYQLNAQDFEESIGASPLPRPLEMLVIGNHPHADVLLPDDDSGHAVLAFRYQDLVILKNIGRQPAIMRGRQIQRGQFIRLFEGQRVLVGELILDYQDLVFYFNAKKNLATTRLYLSTNNRGEVLVEKTRSVRSRLEVRFGLDVRVRALRDTGASINDRVLIEGVEVAASLRDKIDFDNRTAITFLELRRRARALGSRFDLNPARSEYLVSNNPLVLEDGDILLSPGVPGDILLRVRCDYEAKAGELEILQADQPVFVDDFPVRHQVALKDGDTIAFGDGRYLRCHFGEGILEEERNVVNRLQVQDLSYRYRRDHAALDGVSFGIERGEMLCVMGPSGCGKSTLLRILAGQLTPDSGSVLLNGVRLYGSARQRNQLTPYLAYIPHEEAIDPLLTVEENLDFAAAVRAPHLRAAERRRRADVKLVELGLSEMRHRLVGDEYTKQLSGGQRKRLNAGLDMIGLADVYLFDEPTSGLSSKDSEHVLELISGLAHNKIVIVSIHQPSAKLFHLFHKALLLDHGGNVAFFGTPDAMLRYFDEVRREEGLDESPVPAGGGSGRVMPGQPDAIFDVLEMPLRDYGGDLIYEEDPRGHLVPARRFSPGFWRDRFQAHRLIEEVQSGGGDARPSRAKLPPAPPQTIRDRAVQFMAFLKRSFLSKLRDRSNLTTTLMEAPLLALLVSGVLRYAEGGFYSFQEAFHLPTYLFLTLVIGMFLGLTNSADEVLRDRTLLQRERNHRIRVTGYLNAKLLALSFFALVQCAVYIAIGSWVLSIRGMFWHDLFWMFSTTFLGLLIGLVISCFVPNSKTALNIIPLVLIPQIILGGALIEYQEMNRDLDVLSAVKRWVPSGEDAEPAPVSRLEVPLVGAVMPLRWSYEGMMLSHARDNPVTRLKRRYEDAMRELASKPEFTEEDERRLSSLKEARPYLEGLEADSYAAVVAGLRELANVLETGEFRRESLGEAVDRGDGTGLAVSPERYFLNRKVQDLFMQAEMERTDYRAESPPNVFLGARRRYDLSWIDPRLRGKVIPDEIEVATVHLDLAVLVLTAGLAYLVLHSRVHRRITGGTPPK